MADGLSRRQAISLGAAVTGAAVAVPVLAHEALAGTSAPAAPQAVGPGSKVAISDLPWPAAQKIVTDTEAAIKPQTRVFNVMSFGAKGDGKSDNTAAFAAAIKAANAAGGGQVQVPAGTYVSGAIRLLSNVDFHLNANATIKFSGDVSKYPTVLTRYEGIECMNHSPMVYAFGQTNISLTGSGTLDAGGTGSWNKGSDRKYLESLIAKGVTDPTKRVVPGSGHQMRSTFIEPYNCTNVLIQGVTLKNPMFWQIHPTLCKFVIVDGVHTDPNTAHPNTDGCDPECSDHVVIRNCNLGAHDDNIAIKSGRDADGRRINVPTQNVVIYNNIMNGNWGAVTCGSEITGGVKNVYAYKCNIIGATKFALYVKSNTLRGGGAQNVNLDSITGAPTRSYVFLTSTYNGQTGKFPPAWGPFALTNCSSTNVPKVLDVSGLSNDHVKGFTVKNSNFNGVGSTTDSISNVDGLVFTNVKYNGKTVTR
jgi:polygalacturonase